MHTQPEPDPFVRKWYAFLESLDAKELAIVLNLASMSMAFWEEFNAKIDRLEFREALDQGEDEFLAAEIQTFLQDADPEG